MQPLYPSQEIVQIMQRIYDFRMTTTSGGNLSVRDSRGMLWMTPGGLDKGSLQPADIVWMRPDMTFSGHHKVSSEHHLHEHIYRVRPDVGGVLHAHPSALVACSMARVAPDFEATGFAPFAVPGTAALGESVVEIFTAGGNAAVMESHGVVTAAATLTQAFHHFEALEFEARTLICAKRLAGSISHPRRASVALLAEEILPDSHTLREESLRATMANFTRRACRQRLLTSSTARLSARLDAESFLTLPAGADLATITPDDILRLPLHTGHPHAGVFRQNRFVDAITEASPVHATAFSRTGAHFDTRTIPESYVVIRRLDLVAALHGGGGQPCQSRGAGRGRGGLCHRTNNSGSLRPPRSD